MNHPIATGRYQDKRINDSGHFAVRTTRGAPRFPLPYTLEASFSEMQPPREIFAAELHEFRPAYEAHLDRVGVEAITTRLGQLTQQAQGRRVMLLCYCDLEEAQFCHRTLFRNWFLKRTGQLLPETQADQSTTDQGTFL